MVEIPTEELVIIFEPDNSSGFLGIVPIEVVAGYYDENEDRFIDTDLYTYSHVTYGEPGRTYAYRTRVSELLTQFPKANLKELKDIMFDEYSKYKYIRGFVKDEPVVIIENVETNDSSLLMDEDTEANLMLMLNEEEFEKEFLTSSSKDDAESKDELKIDENKEIKQKKVNINPHKLFKEITKTVKGQDDAVRKIVTTIWKNQTKNDEIARNMLILGYTGVGKTEIFRQISKLLDIPLLIISVSGMSQAGYVGASTEDILKSLLNLTKGNVEKAEHAIVVLDEFNKIAYTGNGEGRIATAGIQDELLKITEDGTFSVTYSENGLSYSKMINTAHITFVGLGAPDDILKIKKNKQLGFGNDIYDKEIDKTEVTSEDLKKYGIKEELVGRMGKIILLNPMTIDMCKDIVKTSDKSLYVSDLKFIREFVPNIKITSEEELIEEIAKKTLEKKVGARGISSVVDSMFEYIMEDISNPDSKYAELTFDKEIVNNPKKYILRK